MLLALEELAFVILTILVDNSSLSMAFAIFPIPFIALSLLGALRITIEKDASPMQNFLFSVPVSKIDIPIRVVGRRPHF
jgi:FtsH-binding integral membrane protein